MECQALTLSHQIFKESQGHPEMETKGKKTHLPSLQEMCSLSPQAACCSSQLRENAIFLSAACTGASPTEYDSHTSVQTQ